MFFMVRFIVFLRAINVGGRSVTSAKLHEALTDLGYRNVSVYKQSGNVILEADEADPIEIKIKVENKLCEKLGYDVAAFVRTIPQLKAIINLQPFNCYEKEGASFLVTFLAQALMELPF